MTAQLCELVAVTKPLNNFRHSAFYNGHKDSKLGGKLKVEMFLQGQPLQIKGF